nr:hypothetical protein Q903MT_gene41 [Picea sitchensis]
MCLLQEHRLLTDQGASPQVASPPALLYDSPKEIVTLSSVSDPTMINGGDRLGK